MRAWMDCLSFFVCAALLASGLVGPVQAQMGLAGDAEILQSWQGDFPTAKLDGLPEGQQNLPGDASGGFSSRPCFRPFPLGTLRYHPEKNL